MDANDREGYPIDDKRPSEDIGRAGETSLPQPVANDCDSVLVIGFGKRPAEHRPDAQPGEVARRHILSVHPDRLATHAHLHRERPEANDIEKGLALFSKSFIERIV